MWDLDDPHRLKAVDEFATAMRTVRDHVAQAAKLHYKLQACAWSLDAIELYCNAAKHFLFELGAIPPRSDGLAGFLGYLDAYVASDPFQRMMADAASLKAGLASISYRLLIGLGFIKVSAYRGEADYGIEIQADFAKFRQWAAADHVFKFSEFAQMNHIERGWDS